MLAASTAHPVSRCKYQPPSVSDCTDEPESHEYPMLPADSRIVLDEAISFTENHSSVVDSCVSAQKQAEKNEETIQANPRNLIVNEDNDLVDRDRTKAFNEQNSTSDRELDSTSGEPTVEEKPLVPEEEDPWYNLRGMTKKKKISKAIIDQWDTWGATTKKKQVLGKVGDEKHISQERGHESDASPGPSRPTYDTDMEKSYKEPAPSSKKLHDKRNIKGPEIHSATTDRKKPVQVISSLFCTLPSPADKSSGEYQSPASLCAVIIAIRLSYIQAVRWSTSHASTLCAIYACFSY